MRTPLARRRRPSGGRGGAEPRARIRQRAVDVWALSIRGLTQREIAAQVGISQPAVCQILSRVADQYERDLATNGRRRRTRLIAQMEHLYRLNLAAFERSEEDEVRKRQRRVQASAAAPGQEVNELQVRKRSGDPRFLREARETALALVQLLPVAPATAPVEPRLDFSRLTDDELDTVVRNLAKLQGEEP